MFGAFAGRLSFGITRRVLMCIRIANELGRSAATLVRLTHPERPELIHRITTESELDDAYAPIRVNRLSCGASHADDELPLSKNLTQLPHSETTRGSAGDGRF